MIKIKGYFKDTEKIVIIETDHDFSKSEDDVLKIYGRWAYYQKCKNITDDINNRKKD